MDSESSKRMEDDPSIEMVAFLSSKQGIRLFVYPYYKFIALFHNKGGSDKMVENHDKYLVSKMLQKRLYNQTAFVA